MAGRLKGTPKTGGRQKGTPNKMTSFTREKITNIFTAYWESGDFMNDFANLEPKDRLDFFIKALPFVIPKMQTVSAEFCAKPDKSIEDLLIKLSKEEE